MTDSEGGEGTVDETREARRVEDGDPFNAGWNAALDTITAEDPLHTAMRFADARIKCSCGISVALSNWTNHRLRQSGAGNRSLRVTGPHVGQSVSGLADTFDAPLTEGEAVLLDALDEAEERIAALEGASS